jgi:serine/threonine protein kinase
MAAQTHDNLELMGQASVQRMLQRDGEGNEKILFSDFTCKINRKERHQTRILLISDKAIYNLIPDSYRCKRRIPIKALMGISISQVSDELVIHVDGEYDYRYKANSHRQIITDILSQQFSSLKQKKLSVQKVQEQSLRDKALTKAAAKGLNHVDSMRRKRDFDELCGSDHEDQKVLEQGNRKQSTLGQQQQQQQQPQQQPQQQQPQQQQQQLQSYQQQQQHNTQSQPPAQFEDEEADEEGDTITPINGIQQTKVRVEDFELMKVLGRGSFGKVMQVRHKGDNRIYAMKILKKSAIVARNQVEHTRAERKILQSLKHPFLMTLRWAFQTKDKLYFVLDYFTGGELFYHLKNVRRFPEDVAKIYIAEIASALGHLHSLGYIYRDLKPENILLDHTGHVCLTDFGLSKDVEQGDKAHTFCGTPEYLAPEIVSGQGHDKAVDWWALGILLYELTVGIPPFYDQNSNEMYTKIQRGILRFPPFLSEQCKQLIVALLNRSPDKRLGSFNDLDDIKAHPFYEGFDWEKLLRKEIEVAFKPQVKSADDSSNFDQTFTSEPVVDSLAQPSSLVNGTDFNGFTFDPRANDSYLR